jgi:hypothetical protein
MHSGDSLRAPFKPCQMLVKTTHQVRVVARYEVLVRLLWLPLGKVCHADRDFYTVLLYFPLWTSILSRRDDTQTVHAGINVLARMGRTFLYRFADYCWDHKIHSCFYQGEGRHKTIYGRPEDQPDEDVRSKRYRCEDVDKSDLAFIDTSRFRWYSEYIPVLEATFANQDLCQKMDVFSDDGDHRTFYQLDCPSLGSALMTSVFATHDALLDSAIGLATQSLTLHDWNEYLRQWQEKRDKFAEKGFVHPPSTFDNAWPKAPGRPTVLLDEPAIEVIVQKMVTGATLEDQPFHVDSHHSCFSDVSDDCGRCGR